MFFIRCERLTMYVHFLKTTMKVLFRSRMENLRHTTLNDLKIAQLLKIILGTWTERSLMAQNQVTTVDDKGLRFH